MVHSGEKQGRLDEGRERERERERQRQREGKEGGREKSVGGGWRVSSGEPVSLGAPMVAESPERAVCSSFHKPPVCISLHT